MKSEPDGIQPVTNWQVKGRRVATFAVRGGR